MAQKNKIVVCQLSEPVILSTIRAIIYCGRLNAVNGYFEQIFQSLSRRS